MDSQIILLLGQDGMTNGAVYALLALAIVLVFSTTRVLFVPQGEFVTLAAMSMACMQAGKAVPLSWLLLVLACARAGISAFNWMRTSKVPPIGTWIAVPYSLVVLLLVHELPLQQLPAIGQAVLTLAMIVPFGPLLYDLVFLPIASASTLVLLITSIALHAILVGASLLMFGAEGAHAAPLWEGGLVVGPVTLNAQALWIVAMSCWLIVGLYFFFGRTLYGKALRAASVNRLGAELMGISPAFAGRSAFALAALIGGVSGIMLAPLTTLFYDSGFLISLKGFVGAVIGGLVSYPVAALGALAVGLVESFSTFWASDYKEVIVFALILPFLLWRSLSSRHVEEEA